VLSYPQLVRDFLPWLRKLSLTPSSPFTTLRKFVNLFYG
jgi:hypothetical protein